MSANTQDNGFPSPQLGSGYMDNAFVIVGTLGAITWDIISNLNADYHLIYNFPLSWTVLVYFVSRVATFAAFMLASVAVTQPMNDCLVILSAQSWIFGAAVSFTTLLFFFRVRVLYMQNRYVTGFFLLLWIVVVAGCILETQARGSVLKNLEASRENPFCIADPIDISGVVASIGIFPMVNNILSFVAVTIQIMRNAHVETTFKNGLRVMVFGRYLPAFSRALLKDSQIYFLSTVAIHIVSVVLFYGVEGTQPTSVALVLPNVAVMNLMGGRIYRNARLGIRSLSDVQTVSTPSQPMVFPVPARDNATSEV